MPKGLMPGNLANLLTANESIVAHLIAARNNDVAAAKLEAEHAAQPAPVIAGESPILTEAEFAWAKQTYFDRCAGCHGTLRKGATSPALTPEKPLPKGTLALSTIVFNGTNHGMPDWGKQAS